MNRYVFAASFLMTALSLGCGGGGASPPSSQPPPPPPPPSSPTAIFDPGPPVVGPGVTLNAASPQRRTFTVNVVAQSIPSGAPVYGAAFDMDFDPSLLAFAGFAAQDRGSFFERGGGPVTYQVAIAQGNPGKVVVGVSLEGNRPGVTGSGTILSLRFNIQARSGRGALRFAGNNLLKPNREPVPGIEWSGGTVETRLQ